MTISAPAQLTYSYNGDGTTTAFSYPTKFFENADLVVVLQSSTGTQTVQAITTHYSVSGAGGSGGGTVTMVTAPASGEVLLIYRDTSRKQIVDLADNQRNPAQSVEDQLDRMVMGAQDMREVAARAVKMRVGSTGPTFPEPVSDQIVGWNNAGTALENKDFVTLVPDTVQVLDQDDMASNSDSAVPTQQSVVAYALAKSANLFDVADVSLALENLGVEIRQGYYFGISSANGAAANDTAFAAAMTWLNGADRRALRLPSGLLDVSVTPIAITGNHKFVFGQPYATRIRMAAAATDAAIVRVGDGTTATNRIGVSGIEMHHLKTSGYTAPAIIVNAATDVTFEKSYCVDIPGLIRTDGATSRVTVRDISGSINFSHSVSAIHINPNAVTQSAFRFEDINLIDGTYTAAGSSAASIKVQPTNDGLFDTLWCDNVHIWSLAGMPMGLDVLTSGGAAVNMWLQNCCFDKASTAGARIELTGSGTCRVQDIRLDNFRADSFNGGKNVIIRNTNTNAATRLQDVLFDGAMFPYQVTNTVDVQDNGNPGVFDGIDFVNCTFHAYGSASMTAAMFFEANGWKVTGCKFNQIAGSPTTTYAIQTSTGATKFVVTENIVDHPSNVIDFSQWSAIDPERIIANNTGTGEPWARGRDEVVNRLAAAEANVGSTQTDVAGLSYTFPAMMLVPATRREFIMEFTGILAANANTKTVDVDFGTGTVEIFSNAKNNVRFNGRVTAMVTAADTAVIDWDVQFADASESVGRSGTITIDSDASQLLRMRLTGTANGDININRGRLLLG